MATTAQLTEEATSKFVQAGDIRMHYNEAGTGETVIFLHGGGPGATGWSNFVRNIGPLSEHFHVMLVDMPQYGGSDDVIMTEPHSTVTARAVKDMLDALGIEKANLVGNSMGGAATLAFAVDHNERLNKMVLMGSGGGGVASFDFRPRQPVPLAVGDLVEARIGFGRQALAAAENARRFRGTPQPARYDGFDARVGEFVGKRLYLPAAFGRERRIAASQQGTVVLRYAVANQQEGACWGRSGVAVGCVLPRHSDLAGATWPRR